MSASDQYRYETSLKSARADELINTYVLRPLAGLLVRILYKTPVTPNQVTIASIVSGLVAAFLYTRGETAVIAAGLTVTLKDLLDSADGQLARAKNLYSRRGRFLDSIGDFGVNLALFAAIGTVLHETTEDPVVLILSLVAFAGITLRVSLHVFYHASYLHLEGTYRENRIVEDITEQDRRGDPTSLRLQQVFVFLYGWQDRLILTLDAWCRRGRVDEEFLRGWYSDLRGLRLSGFLGLGTELFFLTFFSLFNALEAYLWFNILALNALACATVGYRRWILYPRLTTIDPS